MLTNGRLVLGIQIFVMGITLAVAGTFYVQKVNSAQELADENSRTLTQISRSALKDCMALHQIRASLIEQNAILTTQPAQLVNPATRKRRSERLHKAIAPLIAAQEADNYTSCWQLVQSSH